LNKSFYFYIKQFVKYLEGVRNYSPKTLISYETDLKQFAEFLKEFFETDEDIKVNLKDINVFALKSYLSYLYEQHKIDIKKTPKYVNKSISRKISTLKSFFKYLKLEKLIDKNPSVRLIFPKLPKKLPTFLTEEEVTSMLDHKSLTDTKFLDKAILELFYSTGIRLSELINLKTADIDFYSGHIKVLGKGSKYRIVPFGSKADTALKNYMQIREISDIKKSEYFFIDNKGNKLYPMKVYRMVNKNISEVSGIKKKSPHVLRHTFATHLINKGAEIRPVSEMLGHASLSSTQVYTHLSLDVLKKAYKQAHPKA